MKTPRTRIAGVVADRTLKSGVVSQQLSRELAAYLLSERRTGELDSILRDVRADWAKAGYVEVVARSAHQLSDTVRADIERQAESLYPAAKQIVVSQVLDPEVIGGVRLTIIDRQLDLSVETTLHRFKQLTLSGKE